MTIDFTGKVAVVTGAGNGLGRSHALELARRGAKVVVNDYGVNLDGSGGSTEAADRVVAEIKAAGGEAIADPGSVTSDEDVARLVERTMDTWGRADIIVNNAGILRDKSFAKMPMDDFRFVIEVHLVGTARVTQAFWSVMKAQQYGRVVFTTSAAGLFGSFGQANYGAAKMGIVGLMKTLCIEGAKDNIRINTIAPIAATRMAATASDPNAEKIARISDVRFVSAGVAALAAEDAPNGVILNAGGGSFSLYKTGESEGLYIDRDSLTAEQVLEALPQIGGGDALLTSPNAGTHAMRLLQLGM